MYLPNAHLGGRVENMSDKKVYPLLDTIKDPGDVQKLAKEQLKTLADEVRCFLIETVSQVGGHFGSNLGVVELTTALHHVFNPEKDRIIWDVGHQSYAHKVLTGRKDRLHTIKQKGGLAPFPQRKESKSDAFGTGHSSTSISAGVGMALAHRGEANAPKVIAVIGDGALTGGMAFEALDHAGDTDADILVVLNDNKMSISPNVGSMTRYLTRLISSPEYSGIREKGKEWLRSVPFIHEAARRVELHAKGLVTPSTIFEEMGFQYFGPVDGHDAVALAEILENLKGIVGPRILHIVTKKGKGCVHAECDALALHAVSAFDPVTGKKNPSASPSQETYTDIFSRWIEETGAKDKRLHAITPAMREGSGLVGFAKKFPKRFHDVGIAEQHAVTFSAGLACEGKKPVVAIYSTFLQRAYDQLIHDVAIQNLDVLFAIDRAGIVGPDGETHAGSFDLSFLRCVPNMTVMAPSDARECRAMLEFGYAHRGPTAVRYPRNSALTAIGSVQEITLGKARKIRDGKKIAILSFGAFLNRCEKVAGELDATLIDMRFVKPIDGEILSDLAKTHTQFVTVEDGSLMGGAGSAVNEYVLGYHLGVRVLNLGLPDTFLPHGMRDEILDMAGLSTVKIQQRIEEVCA